MSDWMARLQLSPTAVKLLVESEDGDLLKARLPSRPQHPRALLTTLEGLALWSGSPLLTVLGVGGRWDPSCGEVLFGGDGWPEDSALVRIEVAAERRRSRRRIRGVGDFRELRQLRLWGGDR